jgi:hypothetical protein
MKQGFGDNKLKYCLKERESKSNETKDEKEKMD